MVEGNMTVYPDPSIWQVALAPLTKAMTRGWKDSGWSWVTGGCFAFAEAFQAAYGGELYGLCIPCDDSGKITQGPIDPARVASGDIDFPVEHALVKLNGKFYDFNGVYNIKPKGNQVIKAASEDGVGWFEDDFLTDKQMKFLFSTMKKLAQPALHEGMRKWMNLFENEIIDEIAVVQSSDIENTDPAGRMDYAFYGADHVRPKKIGKLNSFSIMASHWPLSEDDENYVFLVSGGHPCGFALIRPKGDNLFIVGLIWFDEPLRNQGLGLALYKFLLDSGIALESDLIHTPESKALWQKLVACPAYDVSFLDQEYGQTDDPYSDDNNVIQIRLKESTVSVSDDLDYDYPDDDELPLSKYPFLTDLQKKYQEKNTRRKDRVAAREKNRRQYDDHVEAADREITNIYGRATHKAIVGYKPFSQPLIRFGRFGKTSASFTDDEETEETPFDQIGTQRRFENGVSCYGAYDHKDGTYTLLEPSMASTWNSANNPFIIAVGKYHELYAYLTTGTPMDIFLIHGHLVGEGKNKEYLTSGSDGEPLLDVSKPYKMERIAPEKIIMGRMTYIEFMLKKYGGLEGMKRKIDSDSATD